MENINLSKQIFTLSQKFDECMERNDKIELKHILSHIDKLIKKMNDDELKIISKKIYEINLKEYEFIGEI